MFAFTGQSIGFDTAEPVCCSHEGDRLLATITNELLSISTDKPLILFIDDLYCRSK